MSARAFLDTNILIYATQAGDPRAARAARAAELLAEGGVISVQVLNEFASTAHRRLKRSWPEIRTALDLVRTLCPDIRPLDAATHDAALTLAEADNFSLYDALIVAAALQAGCTTLWSEDMQHGRLVNGRLTIRNPFGASTVGPDRLP